VPHDIRLFQGGTDEQVRTGDPLPPLTKVELALRGYFRVQGRASRSEFWWFMLATILIEAGLNMLAAFLPLSDAITDLFHLLMIIPGITVAVRRLHDIDRTGWWVLLPFTVIGSLLLLFWQVQPGDAGPNRYTLPTPPG
jgi:uncharacterized membrane protein YhaH (DUF805 family)